MQAEPPYASHAPDLDDVIRTHRPFVTQLLRRCGVAERDIPDVEQEVFLVVLRRLPDFEGRSSVRTWLFRIALNVASDFRRRAYHRREALGSWDGAAAHPAPARACPLEQRDTLQQLSAALEQLSEDKREVFLLRELEELPMRDIARRLHVPLKTAFSRLYHARAELRALLGAQGVSFSFAWAWRPGSVLRPGPRPGWFNGWPGIGAAVACCSLALPGLQLGAAGDGQPFPTAMRPPPMAASAPVAPEAPVHAAQPLPHDSSRKPARSRRSRPASPAATPEATPFRAIRMSAAGLSAPLQLPFGFEWVEVDSGRCGEPAGCAAADASGTAAPKTEPPFR